MWNGQGRGQGLYRRWEEWPEAVRYRLIYCILGLDSNSLVEDMHFFVWMCMHFFI